jgi:hypothetical protein
LDWSSSWLDWSSGWLDRCCGWRLGCSGGASCQRHRHDDQNNAEFKQAVLHTFLLGKKDWWMLTLSINDFAGNINDQHNHYNEQNLQYNKKRLTIYYYRLQ